MSKGTSCGNGATRVSASPPSRASSAAADVATRRPSRQPRCWSSRRWGTADLTDVVEHDEGGRSRRDTPAPGLHGTLCPPTTVSSPSPEVSPETPTVPSRVPAGSWTSTPPGTGRARDSGPGASAPWAPPDAITDLSVEPVLRSGCHPVPTGVGGDDAHRRGASPRAPPPVLGPWRSGRSAGRCRRRTPRRPGCGVGPAQRAGLGASSSRTASRTRVSPPSAWALARCRQRVSAGSV